jgi:ADP-heptose:LPS heptosyltransferase
MRLLVIRFSAMGDVALTVPALRGVLQHNPELEIEMVSNIAFEAMFHDIDGLTYRGIDLNKYSGGVGLIKLFKELKSLGPWDAIIDLHSVMRTWVIGGLFRASRVPVYRIDKGRKEKRDLVRKKDRVFKQLKHTTERYLDVFKAFGIEGEVASGDVLHVNDVAQSSLQLFLQENGIVKEKKWLGLAPYSKHKQKTWPFSKINSLIEELGKSGEYLVFLLGGGAEVEDLQNLSTLYPHCHNLAGVLGLEQEIALMHKLDVVVAMDSFNMHLAALCDVKVVSIWGGTHPYAGFGPLSDNEKFIVQVDNEELDCRPCSVFGSKPCHRGDWACLDRVSVEDVQEIISQD